MIKQKKQWVLFGVFTLAIILINILYPIIHDDLHFQSLNTTNIYSAAYSSFYYGNGRYLGNFMQMYFMSHDAFRIIAKTILMEAYLVFISLLASKKGKLDLTMPIVLFFCTSLFLFRQAIAWNAGFFNYFVPAVFMLATLYIYKIYPSLCKGAKIFSLFALLILGVSEQLFAEHGTIICVFLSISLIIVDIITKRHSLIASSLLLVSNLLGAFIMFAGPIITDVAGKMEAYRTNAVDLRGEKLIDMLKLNLFTITSNAAAFTMAAIVLSLVIYSLIKNEKKLIFKLYKIILILLPVISVIQYFWGIADGIADDKAFKKSLCVLLLMCLYYIPAIIIIIAKYKNQDKKYIIIYFAFFICSCGILLPVNPIGARCFWLAYTFLSLAVLTLYNSCVDIIPKRLNKAARITLSTLLICCCVAYTAIYAVGYYVNVQRNECITREMAKKEEYIFIPDIPFEQFIWKTGATYVYPEIYYYEKAGDIKFRFLPYKEWLEYYK